jgi:NAD(P)H-quinone oxidoreductase subunit K
MDGIVTMKMAPSLVRLYEQMLKPKYVIAMGTCTIIGGMFSTDSYSTIYGVDKLILVDIYLLGCPSKLEAIINYIKKICKKVAQETYGDKTKFQRGNKYLTLKH